jgi:hypothetical protein
VRRRLTATEQRDLEAKLDENLRRLDEATRQWAQADEDHTEEDSYVVVAPCPVDPLEREAPPPAVSDAASSEHAAGCSSSGADGGSVTGNAVEMHETSAAEWDGATAQVNARAPFPWREACGHRTVTSSAHAPGQSCSPL